VEATAEPHGPAARRNGRTSTDPELTRDRPPCPFDHAAGFFGSPSFAVHPISLRGADAAVELVGPDLGTVYARRMDLVFALDVGRGKGEDTAAEERIATIVLIHR
jgi:hypothetical protein